MAADKHDVAAAVADFSEMLPRACETAMYVIGSDTSASRHFVGSDGAVWRVRMTLSSSKVGPEVKQP